MVTLDLPVPDDGSGATGTPGPGWAVKVNNAFGALNAGKAESSHSHAQGDVSGLVAALNARAPLASPTFTGMPTVPTAAPGTSTPTTATATLTAAASAGTISLSLTGTVVTASVQGLTISASPAEAVATLPAGYRPSFPQGHCFLVDQNGEWWPCYASATQVLVLGPAPVGTVLSGSLTWRI